MNRYDLTDFEWSVIQPLQPNKPEASRVWTTGAYAALNAGFGTRGERSVVEERENPGGRDASSRFAAPLLRSGPSGDTPQLPGWGLAMVGSRLPAIEGRQYQK